MEALTQWSESAAWLRLDLLVTLLLATLLGGAIGFEREYSGKPAGLRTNILICVGAALITELSFSFATSTFNDLIRADPARLAAQIVSGIGFLGAGTIIQARGSITGLTTAATLWVVAAIGIAVGMGSFVEAAGTTVLVLFTLVLLARLEDSLLEARTRRTFELTLVDEAGVVNRIMAVMEKGGLRVVCDSARLDPHREAWVAVFQARGRSRGSGRSGPRCSSAPRSEASRWSDGARPPYLQRGESPPTLSHKEGTESMVEIFKAAIEKGASDIHIKSGDVVRARIHGRLVAMTEQRLSNEQVQQLAMKLMPKEKDRERLAEINDYDCSWGLSGLGRFRVNILRQRGSFMIVMRVIPIEIPTFDDLDLPPVLKSIAENKRGMVLVTGVTGSGKSSTMAAMVRYINEHMEKHIVTLEDPIEFLHRDQKSSITQRDVGTDTENFKTGLRAALRQDPDVIQVGEMRDRETVDIALKAAETGHLVMSTLHTQNAVRTLSRIISVFDPKEQEMIRIRLGESLQAVVSQRLLPRADREGRIAAVEVMLATGTVRDCIQDANRIEEIPDLIEEGRDHYGSQSFDQHLMELVKAGKIDFQVAKAAASSPSDFDLKMNTFASGPGETADDMSHLFGN